jgi:hypothetical protein
MRLALATTVIASIIPIRDAPANASGCRYPVTAAIMFAPGARCWRYEGKATSFRGTFDAGQRVTATMAGLADFGDEKMEWLPRSPYASGPGGSHFSGGEGSMSFVVERTGKHEFGFSPCAMWHGFGRVTICKAR